MLEFYRGLKSNYPVGQVVSGHELYDAIYFATDTHEILVNGEAFGLDDQRVKSVRSENGQLIFTVYQPSSADANESFETEVSVGIGLDDSTQKAIETLKGLLGEDGNLNISLQYQSAMDDDYATVGDFGGIKSGTRASDLKKKTLSQVLDDLLFPTIQPTKTDHTVSIARKSGVSDIKEVGATPWVETDFSVTTSVGAININNVKKQDYTGAVTGTTFTGFPVAMTYGAKTVKVTATFAAGPQPLDSKGDNATSVAKYAGGTKEASTTLYVVYPRYANNGADITAFTKLALIRTGVALELNYAAAAVGSDVHTLKTYEAVKTFGMWDEENGKYLDVTDWKETGTETINGVSYHVYKTDAKGASKYKFTF